MFGPEALVAIEPLHRLLHRAGGEPARHGAPGLLARDQACVRQHVEMFHDRGQRHRERLGQFAHRDAVPAAEPRQQRAPRRIRQRGKGAVQDLVVILNHTVKYNDGQRPSSDVR